MYDGHCTEVAYKSLWMPSYKMADTFEHCVGSRDFYQYFTNHMMQTVQTLHYYKLMVGAVNCKI